MNPDPYGRTMRIMPILASVLLLAACSAAPTADTNADGSAVVAVTHSVIPKSAQAVAPNVQARTTAAIAKALGCTKYVHTDPKAPGAYNYGAAVLDTGRCKFKGVDTELYVLADPRDVGALRAVAKLFGIDPSIVASKGVWAAAPGTFAVLSQIQSALDRTA